KTLCILPEPQRIQPLRNRLHCRYRLLLAGHYIRFSIARNVIRAVIGLFVRPSGQPSRTPALTRAWIATTQGESVKWGSPDATGGLWDSASVTELDPQGKFIFLTWLLESGPTIRTKRSSQLLAEKTTDNAQQLD